MPGMDKTGPEGKGRFTGRKLGRCAETSDEELLKNLGRGLGRRRRAEDGGRGKGLRLRSGRDDRS